MEISVDFLDGGVSLPGEAFDAYEEFCESAFKSCMLLRGQVQESAAVEQNRLSSNFKVLAGQIHRFYLGCCMPFPSGL